MGGGRWPPVISQVTKPFHSQGCKLIGSQEGVHKMLRGRASAKVPFLALPGWGLTAKSLELSALRFEVLNMEGGKGRKSV